MIVVHLAETCSLGKMTSIGLRSEDSLDGSRNFVSWKAKIVLLLRENELWDETVNNTTAHPIVIPSATTDAVAHAAFEKKDIKAMRIILDAVKDHVISHISGKDHAHEMWSALTGLFQSTNENRKMVLREKVKDIKMVKGEMCMTYLTRISQVRDELVVVGVAITGPKLVRRTLNGVIAPWAVFV